jgi:transposase
MAHYTRGEDVLARSAQVSIGIDVHQWSWHVTALVEDEKVFSGAIPAEYAALTGLLGRFEDCELRAAYEAGPCGFGLFDALERDGVRCIVTPPSLMPMEIGNRVKTNRRDSLKLARLLAAGMLRRVFVLTEEQRAHRELVRTRRQLVTHRAETMMQIKMKLLFHSLRVPGGAHDAWSRRYVAALRALPYPYPAMGIAVGALLTTYEHLKAQIAALNREIQALARSEMYRERVKLLTTVPGIGVLSAMEILTELGDVARFRSNEALASYLGLTPSEFSSGESVHQGHITRCGNARLRSTLVEDCWCLVRIDPAMRKKYERIKRFRGGKRAIVAIARTLAGRIRHILLHREPYVLGTTTGRRKHASPPGSEAKALTIAEVTA